MRQNGRSLKTPSGEISFPAYVPVTTFGDKYPLDDLVRPYLPRLAPAVMVSFHYARQMKEGQRPRIPLMVDSGGFASLFENASVVEENELGVLVRTTETETERLHPLDVLELQERIADIAFTLDFPIPPGMDLEEARRRQRLTIANALWALQNRRRAAMPLYACIQAWDVESARACAERFAREPFDGLALGGMVPRARDPELVLATVRAVRDAAPAKPLHVFGLGSPGIVERLFDAGVDSVDSSSYVKLAADGKIWGKSDFVLSDAAPLDRLHIALCNLAIATGRALPLSAVNVLFGTRNLKISEEVAPWPAPTAGARSASASSVRMPHRDFADLSSTAPGFATWTTIC
jgi:helicase